MPEKKEEPKEATAIEIKAAAETCESRTFVITDKVQIFKNRDKLVAYVERSGGHVAGSVTAKTDFLINNDIASSYSKNKKAKELGIPILTEEEFVKRFVKD